MGAAGVNRLKPYWITTDHAWVGLTAFSEDDAKRELDHSHSHVAANMGIWLKRGVWYPRISN